MRRAKQVLAAVMIFALAVGSLAACGGGSGGSGSGGGQADAETIKIGLNYELTGGVATYGQASVDGIKMAVDEINAAGGINGKQIELVEYDNRSEEAEAVSIATRLMTQDNVTAIIGPATSGRFKAQVPLAEQNQIPIISGSTTADDVTVDASGVKEFAFRICFSDSFQGVVMANFAQKNLSAKTAVIIADNSSDYGIGLAKNFKSTFEAGGGTVVAEEAYVAKDTDFNGILTSIKSKTFDVIFLPGYYEEAGLIIKQARAQGITAPILGVDGFDSPTLLELAGADALNNVYFSNHYSPLDQDPLVRTFIDNFNTKYSADPGAFHALGYDAAKFLADAIKRAGSGDPVAVKQALESTTDFVGVTGTFSVDENHNAVKSAVVIALENGAQASSEKVNP